MKIVRESIDFERGGDIKNHLFGFRPGQIIIRDLPRYEDIYMFVGMDEGHNPLFRLKVFELGRFTSITGVTDIPFASLIFDKKMATIRHSPADYFRFPNSLEKPLIEKALHDPQYKFYISLAKEITGLTPWV